MTFRYVPLPPPTFAASGRPKSAPPFIPDRTLPRGHERAHRQGAHSLPGMSCPTMACCVALASYCGLSCPVVSCFVHAIRAKTQPSSKFVRLLSKTNCTCDLYAYEQVTVSTYQKLVPDGHILKNHRDPSTTFFLDDNWANWMAPGFCLVPCRTVSCLIVSCSVPCHAVPWRVLSSRTLLCRVVSFLVVVNRGRDQCQSSSCKFANVLVCLLRHVPPPPPSFSPTSGLQVEARFMSNELDVGKMLLVTFKRAPPSQGFLLF